MTRFRVAKLCSKWLQERIGDHNIQSDYKYKSGLKVRIQQLVCYACVVTMHDADTNDDMTTMTLFHTEHINRNTWVYVRSLVHLVSAHRHTLHMHRIAQVVSLVFICHPIHMRSWCVRFSLDIDLSILFTLYLTHLLSHFFHFFPPLEVRRQPEHSAQREYGLHWRDLLPQRLWAQRLRLQGDLCRALHRAPEFAAVPLRHRFPEDAEYDDAALEGMLRETHRVHSHHSQREDLSFSLSSSSVSDRTGRPVGDSAGDLLSQVVRKHRFRTLLDDHKEQILAECQAIILTDMNFKPLTKEEVYENWVKLLNLIKKNFTALELKKVNDEINSFFMDSNCSKTWNYVKLIRKVSVKWKS